ncbi:MAG TPA: hypothetical protein GX010_05295 [Erysipelotrichaceae bacterium]|nr:hypothetical protein [Erysipelotrichaceae bacterium]
MVQQTLAKEILGKIINENIPFSLALKSAFKHNNTPREERAIISAIVGCVLRHYLVMDKIVKLAYPEMDNEGVILALIALSNALFIKKLDQEKCQEATNAFIKENEPPIETFIESYLSERKLVPVGIEVGSHEFLSYRYNTPVNIVKMWYKQFGHISTTKILRANSRPPQVVVRINNNSIDDESFFTQFVDFEKIEGISGVALYRGETKFKNHAVREKRLASPLSLAYKEMFDEGDVDLLKGLAIYSEYPNDIFNELLSRFPTLDNIEYIANNLNTCNNVKRFLARNNIHRGVNVYEAQASSIITCVSKPVHTFLVMPDNSHLNLLQLLPDYFLRFDMEKLDELIANQKIAIREASAQVEDGGYLLYLVDTISKKESSAVINDFLNEHRDFSLVRDKQYFPYKKYGCSYYFAVLKKGKVDD